MIWGSIRRPSETAAMAAWRVTARVASEVRWGTAGGVGAGVAVSKWRICERYARNHGGPCDRYNGTILSKRLILSKMHDCAGLPMGRWRNSSGMGTN